jgi:hypothetical protein
MGVMAAARTHRIEITVGDPPGGAFGGDDRPALQDVDFAIDLRDDEPLRPAVMGVAAAAVEAWWEEAGIPPGSFQPVLAVGVNADAVEIGQGFTVASDGRVRSTLDVASEPFADLLRAYELGLIAGDPRRVHVWRLPSSFGVGGAAWDMFAEAIKVLGAVGGTYAGVEVIGKALAAFRRAAEVLLRHQEELEERGFAPPDALRLAARRRWRAEELARALNITSDEVVVLLEGFGFERTSGGTWHAPRDLPRQVGVVLLSALTGYEASMNDAEALAERCRRDLAQIIEELDQS